MRARRKAPLSWVAEPAEKKGDTPSGFVFGPTAPNSSADTHISGEVAGVLGVVFCEEARHLPYVPLLKARRMDLGFSLEELAAEAGWASGRQEAIEAADELEAWEADVLSDLLGLDVFDLLDDEAARPAPVAALLRNSRSTLAAETRFEVIKATRIGQEWAELRLLVLGDEPPLWSRFQDDKDYGHPADGVPERLANRVRDELGVADAPISSVFAVVKKLGIPVFWTQLPEEVDAFSFADENLGPFIVLNASGPHTATAFCRRTTLAHEICHALFDRTRMRQMSSFCEVATGTGRERAPTRKRLESAGEGSLDEHVERRARAFAAYFIAPRASVHALWTAHAKYTPEVRVRLAMEEFGMGYEAIRAQLQNVGLLPIGPRLRGVDQNAPPELELADPGISDNEWKRHRAGIPLLRSGEFFELVGKALEADLISEGQARDYLRVSMKQWADDVRQLVGAPNSGTWRVSSAL